MKKLINKLKAKPKLYKCLKILAVVGICLSLIFNAVILGSAIANYNKSNNKDNDYQVRNVATTPIKHISSDQYYTKYVTQTEFLTLYDSWVRYFTNLWGADNPFVYGYGYSNQNQGWEKTLDITEWRFKFYLEQIEDLYNNLDKKYEVTRINFSASRVANEFYQTKRITMTFQNTDNTTFERSFLYHIYDRSDPINTLTDGEMIGSIYYIYVDNQTYAQIMNECLVFPQNSDMWEIINNVQADTYNNGYQVGFNEGNNLGYERGYNVGYANGVVAGSEGVENDAFTIISQAFNSLASILNINILPNLSLGLLIFAPLIIIVIIAIVKIFRG